MHVSSACYEPVGTSIPSTKSDIRAMKQIECSEAQTDASVPVERVAVSQAPASHLNLSESVSMAVNITGEKEEKEKSEFDTKKREKMEEEEEKKKMKTENVASFLPRSRLSVFAQTFLRTAQSSLLNTPLPPSSTFSLNKSICLDSSILKNGSVISSLVTYANSVHDIVEKAIVS